MKKHYLFLSIAILILAGCPSSPNTYNCLVWNRENFEADSRKVDTGPWFEWWYYKVVLPDTGDAFYFVYGVVNPWDTGMTDPASHAFVGFGNFAAKTSVTNKYSVADFQAAYDKTDVTIRDQHATATAISGNVTEENVNANWNVQISTLWDFNAMGSGMFIPDISNIYWYPAQAAAFFSGEITYNGKTYTFDKVPGYQDRNCGRSFPAWWTWITANHFEGNPDTIFAAGGGQPTLLSVFDNLEGLVIGLRHNGEVYEFRPGDGDWERITIDFGTWQVEALNTDGYKIEIQAAAPCNSFMDLVFDTPQGVRFHDFETLTGTLFIRLYRLEGFHFRLLETLHSDFAGIEYGNAEATRMDCHENDSKVLFENF